MPARHLLVKGKVQGVFYRASARKVARSAGISGWIRNTPEGHVEAQINGPEDKLEEFIRWCRQGPPEAIVTDVIIHHATQTDLSDFTIR